MINQLFRKIIPSALLEKILLCFNLKGLNDSKIFTKYDLHFNNTIAKLNQLKSQIEVYYVPCKGRIYLDDITIKKCITILRQVLRLYDFNLETSERYIAKKKSIAYQMVPMNKNKTATIINAKSTIITFD